MWGNEYRLENIRWKEQEEMKVTNEAAEMIVKKLSKHFKIYIRSVSFKTGGWSFAYRFGKYIRFRHNPSMRTICHEVCHLYCWDKFDKKVQHGSKKWLSQMKIVINYCKRKNYWKEELERRTAPKEPKPKIVLTIIEIRLRKLTRHEKANKKYKAKVKRCLKMIKVNNRRISALKRFI